MRPRHTRHAEGVYFARKQNGQSFVLPFRGNFFQILRVAFMDGGKHGASGVMADWGGATRDELNWRLKRAAATCCREGTFEEHANDQGPFERLG
jgi:hypothetical protein